MRWHSVVRKPFFNHNGKAVKGVLTISAVSDQINETLARLLDDEVQNILLSGNTQQILTALNGGKCRLCQLLNLKTKSRQVQ